MNDTQLLVAIHFIRYSSSSNDYWYKFVLYLFLYCLKMNILCILNILELNKQNVLLSSMNDTQLLVAIHFIRYSSSSNNYWYKFVLYLFLYCLKMNIFMYALRIHESYQRHKINNKKSNRITRKKEMIHGRKIALCKIICKIKNNN